MENLPDFLTNCVCAFIGYFGEKLILQKSLSKKKELEIIRIFLHDGKKCSAIFQLRYSATKTLFVSSK